MKIKAPKHCAHVAAFYANKADIYRGGKTLHNMLPFIFSDGVIDPQGGKNAIRWAVTALEYTRRAAREFVAAGGAA